MALSSAHPLGHLVMSIYIAKKNTSQRTAETSLDNGCVIHFSWYLGKCYESKGTCHKIPNSWLLAASAMKKNPGN